MRKIGPAVQKELAILHPDPFVQVAILRVYDNTPHLLADHARQRLADATTLDALPTLKATGQ